MMDQLIVKNIVKKYRRQTVLDNISFILEPAKIYGLLGRNGAGKTTLLNIMSNRIFPTSGEVKIGNEDVNNNDDLLSKIFLMSEVNLYPRHMKISQTFDLADAAYNNFDYDLANRLLKVFGLNDRMKITNLSTGQRTASKLIVALAVNADYVLLDEPILGLDANHRDSFYKELVKTYQERPRTFVLSTHLIEEIQQLVEHVLIMDQHHIIINEDTESLLAKAYAISGPEKMVDEYTAGLKILKTEMMGNIKTAYLLDRLDEQRVIPDQVKIGHYDLQHLFIYLTDGENTNEKSKEKPRYFNHVSTSGARYRNCLRLGLGIALITYLLGLIISHNLESFLVSLQALPSIASSILSVLLMAIFLVTPYTDFKWAIQNGISRKTLWQGRILSLFLMTLVVWFIAQLVGLMNTPFDLVSAWHSLLWYFGFSLTMMAIGNGFALLNRRWKWIVGIGLPMACLVLFMMLAYSLVGLIPALSASGVFKSIIISNVTGWVILVIYLIIVYALARFFNNKIQLRRD